MRSKTKQTLWAIPVALLLLAAVGGNRTAAIVLAAGIAIAILVACIQRLLGRPSKPGED
jgi:hypothetical protein